MDQTSASSRVVPPESFPQTPHAPHFREFIRFFRAAIRPWRWVYLAMFAGVLLVTAAGYVLPVVQKRLINALAGRESDGIWALFLAAGALMLLKHQRAGFRELFRIGKHVIVPAA